MPRPGSDSSFSDLAIPIQPPKMVSSEATWGFFSGAFRFTSISLVAHIMLQRVHPVYRGLTVQFKVFIQLSALMLGGCIFAEKRVTEYNDMMRRRQRAYDRSNQAWNEEMEMRAVMERKEMEKRSGNAAEDV